jgi:chemotaxis protein CheY-P-specific phosphatase CheC
MLFPSDVLTEEQAELPFTHGVSVRFYGPKSGRLEVRASAEIVPALTANMLGAEEAVDPQLQRDALGELGNVLCGNVVSSMTTAWGCSTCIRRATWTPRSSRNCSSPTRSAWTSGSTKDASRSACS